MTIHVNKKYLIEVQMVCDDGYVIRRYTALEPADLGTAMKYWVLFEDAVCSAFEKNLFEKTA